MTSVENLVDQIFDGDVVDVVGVARVVGVPRSAVDAWRSHRSSPPRQAHERLAEMRSVISLARRTMADGAARRWTQSPNADLDGRTPLELVASGEYRLVVALLLAVGEGVTS